MTNQITTVEQLKEHILKELKGTHIAGTQHNLTLAHCNFVAGELMEVSKNSVDLQKAIAGLYHKGVYRNDSFLVIQRKLDMYEETGDSNQEYIWHFIDFFRANPQLILNQPIS